MNPSFKQIGGGYHQQQGHIEDELLIGTGSNGILSEHGRNEESPLLRPSLTLSETHSNETPRKATRFGVSSYLDETPPQKKTWRTIFWGALFARMGTSGQCVD